VKFAPTCTNAIETFTLPFEPPPSTDTSVHKSRTVI
jgi:hypothetical protein